MADITKVCDRILPDSMRYVYWASSENADDATPIAADDVFRIYNSLGRNAKRVTIDVTGASDLAVRFNSRITIFPRQFEGPDQAFLGGEFHKNVAKGVETRTKVPVVTIGGTTSLTWSLTCGELGVSDIEITTWTSGTFTIFAA